MNERKVSTVHIIIFELRPRKREINCLSSPPLPFSSYEKGVVFLKNQNYSLIIEMSSNMPL